MISYIYTQKVCEGCSHIILNYTELDIQPNATYEENPLKIQDRQRKLLRAKTMPLVKVFWSNQGVEEASWEKEEDMRKEHPKLFED